MTDPGYNEVVIRVTTEDAGAAARTKIKSDNETLGKTEVKIPVTLSDPVTDAWRAQVNAEIKAAAKQSLNIPVNADTADLRGDVESALADAKSFARMEVPVEVADADAFKASVEGLVASVRAEIAAGIEVPVTLDTSNAATQIADLTPAAQDTSAPTSLRPDYTPAPLAEDPYAQAREQLASEPPIEVPVVAADPITQAWRAKVSSEIKSLTNMAVQIPVTADTAGFRDQVSMQLAELSDLRENIPLEVANSDQFRMAVTEQVAEISESVRAVISVDADDASLVDLRAKILAAADATSTEAKAQQDLADAMAKGNADEIAKAQQDLAAAEVAAGEAADEQATAMSTVAAVEVETAVATDGAALSMRSLGVAMGPLWGVLQVAQMAMYGFGSSTGSAESSTQGLAQQVITLGQATSSSAGSMLSSNQALQTINTQLTGIGSSSAEFAQAFSGNMTTATVYIQKLTTAQQQLGQQTTSVTENANASNKAGGEMTAATKQVSESVEQMSQSVAGNKEAYDALTPSQQAQVTAYNNYAAVIPQAKQALQALQATQALEKSQLDAVGMSLSANQSEWNSYGQAVQSTDQAFNDATSGLKYLFDSVDSADIAAGQAAQSYQQLQQAVTTAAAAETSAANGVTTAQHAQAQAAQAVVQAQQGVVTAQQGAVNAQFAYNQALQTEQQDEQNIMAARAAAAQQLKDLALQQVDSTNSQAQAQVQLLDAQSAVNAAGLGNQTLSSLGPLNAQNEAAYKLLLALAQAQANLNDVVNQGSQISAQKAAADAAGIDGNAGVLGAQQQLTQANQAAQQAQEALASSKLALVQAGQAVADAQFQEKQAHLATQQALNAEQQAQQQYSTAVANSTTKTDDNSMAAAKNRDTIEQLYEKNYAVYGPTIAAAQATEQQGNAAGFTATQVDQVITSLGGLNGKTSYFGLVGQPSVDLSQLINAAEGQGLNPATLGFSSSQIGNARADVPMGGSYAAGGPARGGPAVVGENGYEVVQHTDGSQRLVGLHGPEIVNLEPGSQVMPAANSAAMFPHFAAGGVVGANIELGEVGGMFDAARGAYSLLGAQGLPTLPTSNPAPTPAPTLAASSGGGGGGGVSGSRAANKAIMQQVFASMFGWTGQEWSDAVQLEMMEAGFNNTAQNPTSTAYGMGQFLDGTWASYGIPKTSDPTQQSIAMGRYISARYGDPAGALAHEDAHHWYAAGGPAGGVVGINDGGPEVVNLPNGSQIMPAANSASLARGGELALKLEIAFTGNTDTAMATAFMKLVRANQIQMNVNGQRVKVG